MTTLVDVVNFNADASCLSSAVWLRSLAGGSGSDFYRWLNLYVSTSKKVTLGLTGATISDLAHFNPESLTLIRANPEIFEMIVRPFSHDIALIRTPGGFLRNLDMGIKTIVREFSTYTPYYLPPEFMLTNEQLGILDAAGIRGTFVNAARFKGEMGRRLPTSPYLIQGLLNTQMNCIPFGSGLTQTYLNALHFWDSSSWNNAVLTHCMTPVFSWRDGESPFFLPDGITREANWLESESSEIHRGFLRDHQPVNDGELRRGMAVGEYGYYPIHSFTAWMREFKMLGFINRLMTIEGHLDTLTDRQLGIWLQATNSDILSAIEKESPVISLKPTPRSEAIDHVLWRSERGVEGELFLLLIENLDQNRFRVVLDTDMSPVVQKLRGRLAYLGSV